MLPPRVKLSALDCNNADHVGCMYKVRTHPHVDQHLHGSPPKSLLEHIQYLHHVKQKDFFILNDDEKYFGYCHRSHFENEIELGWAIHPDYWGKGIGSFSVQSLVNISLPLQKPLTLSVQKSNTRAVKLYQRHNFVIFEESDLNYKMIYEQKS